MLKPRLCRHGTVFHPPMHFQRSRSGMVMMLALCWVCLFCCGVCGLGVHVVHGDGVDGTRIQQWTKHLHSQGLEVTVVSGSSSDWHHNLTINNIDNLVLLGLESSKLVGVLSPTSLLSMASGQTNLIIAIDKHSVGSNYNKLASQLNIIQPTTQKHVIDHSHSNSHHLNLQLAPNLDPIIQTSLTKPIHYNGLAHQLNRSPLSINLGHASPTAYVESDQSSGGTTLALVSAVQLKNNRRIIWSGSLDLFTDKTWTDETDNGEFVTQLSLWAFQQTGQLQIDHVNHLRVSDNQTLSLYKVNDQLRYSVQLSTTDQQGARVPIILPDVQVEFTMLDPHLRVVLSQDPIDRSALSATFNAPDRHGVFTLNLDYRRPGYSFISDRTVISVTPPRHDQYDRFIKGAAPFYAGAATVTLATLSFIAIWATL